MTPLGAVSSRGLADHIGSSLSILRWALRAAHTTRYFQDPVPKYLDRIASQGLALGDRRRCTHKGPPRVPNRDLRTQTPAHFGQKVKFISPASENPHPLVTDKCRDCARVKTTQR